MSGDLPVLRTFEDLCALLDEYDTLFVRYSRGPDADRAHTSRDYESGLELPGLAVNPLHPEPWWSRPAVDWLARRLCAYVHIRDESNDERRAWILTGRVVGRGPDNEPLVDGVVPVAWVDDGLVDEAKRLYEERFEVARDSTG